MEILYLLIAISMLRAAGGLLAFLWATANGQFQDLTRPGSEILYEDPPASKVEK